MSSKKNSKKKHIQFCLDIDSLSLWFSELSQLLASGLWLWLVFLILLFSGFVSSFSLRGLVVSFHQSFSLSGKRFCKGIPVGGGPSRRFCFVFVLFLSFSSFARCWGFDSNRIKTDCHCVFVLSSFFLLRSVSRQTFVFICVIYIWGWESTYPYRGNKARRQRKRPMFCVFVRSFGLFFCIYFDITSWQASSYYIIPSPFLLSWFILAVDCWIYLAAVRIRHA